MKSKIPAVFSISNHVNILSSIIFWGVFGFYQTYTTKGNKIDFFSDYFFLILIIAIYSFIYFLGAKLMHQYNRQTYGTDPKKAIRVVFYLLELILILFYSYLAYSISLSLKLANFFPLTAVNSIKLIALLAFYTGYVSSIIRLCLTWPFFNMVKNQNIYLLEHIGEIGAT